METVRTYSPFELGLAVALALIIQGGFFLLLAAAENTARITAKETEEPEEVPIAVQPVLDDVPLLKLGSKKRATLPDMWMKKPPVKRFKDVSAPSPMAEKTIEKAAETPLAKADEVVPPPDAALAKEVDEIPEPEQEPSEQTHPEEGAEDGVKEGTETDPLKAFAVSQYRMKIAGWFNARFKRPTDEIPCDELKKLRASVSASVGQSRTVTGYTIVSPSGNATFDARVRATMDGIQSSGAELPPPPPNYPDILGTTISAGFSVPSCD